MNQIKLSPRLQTIADFVPHGAKCADIGTDHGYIPVYLVQNGICTSVIASDINKGPSESAIRSGQYYGVDDKIRYICAPGLDGILKGEVDTIIIAGMGGETIIQILQDAPWLDESITLILQPQSKIELLQRYLSLRGFVPDKAKLVKDAGKLYLAFRATILDAVCDDYFLNLLDDDELKNEYIDSHLKQLKVRAHGLKTAGKENEEYFEIQKKIEYLSSKRR